MIGAMLFSMLNANYYSKYFQSGYPPMRRITSSQYPPLNQNFFLIVN